MKSISAENSISQQLLFPISIEFSVSDISLLKLLEDTLFAMGFLLSFQENKAIISGIPIYIKENQVEQILLSLIENSAENIPENTELKNEFLAKSICKNFIYNSLNSLSSAEQQQLIEDLQKIGNPQFSPFQKKIYTIIPVKEIEYKL